MNDGAKRYRRKPAEYTVAARLFNDAGEPVVRLVAGDFDAIEVPWDEFKGDFEAVKQGAEVGPERCRVGEWLPANRLHSAVRPIPAACTRVGADDRVYFDVGGVVMGCSLEDWDAARARWIADGRPSS